ncbi:WXG100 family type VII secretion target [Terribacillus saccharophilus]|jgi:WXG100 family type VII secretion target|uniref:ESAT-6-like protein n=1 Tax=Terribacillus saccharophilus TaxID=361277 RepID=A0A1H8BLA9_9BACI|nr:MULTISPECIES: WXG100 family type VII secretion target [Terribacillus]AIF66166.1 type VII secretion protein EsxA [Terribacillus goriensis]MCM3225151.1 WXG100 family type VII secretion target [Terribacillus saccharophilus]MEC0281339.1 WXG100 family type VII secretion target [Terribacillus saccharophilus]MEC0289539.1 WXG100 family type VII secretion target [Terribacillus saccharophilus]MEC0303642.1 WXG100 family type VII secretion target [Terribacillus saccharophilus]
MSGQIRMTPEQLQSHAKRYRNSSEQIDSILSDLNALQVQLRSEWEGRAFDRFDEQFIQLQPKVQEFSQLMLDIQLQLEKTAQAVQDQDQALSQNFGFR